MENSEKIQDENFYKLLISVRSSNFFIQYISNDLEIELLF